MPWDGMPSDDDSLPPLCLGALASYDGGSSIRIAVSEGMFSRRLVQLVPPTCIFLRVWELVRILDR